jgi:hypothetical protein
METAELQTILDKHKKWSTGESGGIRANLSNANLRNAYLSGANLRNANLRNANLSGANLRNANLRNANLSDANLSDAYLSGANLRNANLRNANLRNANLSNANLSNANLPTIIKIDNLFTKIKDAIENGGELEMGDWHKCETTHCAAGWVTNLAGDVGRVAENLVGTPWAATLIINESCPYLNGKVPNFYASNEYAMDFINQCAETEKSQ